MMVITVESILLKRLNINSKLISNDERLLGITSLNKQLLFVANTSIRVGNLELKQELLWIGWLVLIFFHAHQRNVYRNFFVIFKTIHITITKNNTITRSRQSISWILKTTTSKSKTMTNNFLYVQYDFVFPHQLLLELEANFYV